MTTTIPAAPRSLVPGGGLDAHEALGGTTLARHVGRSAADLRDGLEAEPTLRRLSSFPNRALAEAAVAEAMKLNHARIRGWVNANQRFDLVVTHASKLPVGVIVARGGALAPAHSTRVVLRRHSRNDLGYFILSAAPTSDGPSTGPRRDYLQLQWFFGAYFHQDYAATGRTATQVIQKFVRDVPAGTVKAALGEMDAALLQLREPALLEQMLFDRCGCEFDPAAAGKSAREWLQAVQETMVAFFAGASPDRKGGGMQLRWTR